jgi:DNA-binding transcriptional MerR regulator
MAARGMTARGPVSADRDGVADTPLTIGELAARTGVTAETIRYYEREGVIPPAERRGSGQYRRYAAADAERLRFVRRARDLGFSLDEVRELLDLAAGQRGGPCAEVNRMARAHLAQVDVKLAQLAALRTELGRLVASCDRGGAVANCSLLSALSGAPEVEKSDVV